MKTNKHEHAEAAVAASVELCKIIDMMREVGQDPNVLTGRMIHAHEVAKLANKKFNTPPVVLEKGVIKIAGVPLRRGSDLVNKSKGKS